MIAKDLTRNSLGYEIVEYNIPFPGKGDIYYKQGLINYDDERDLMLIKLRERIENIIERKISTKRILIDITGGISFYDEKTISQILLDVKTTAKSYGIKNISAFLTPKYVLENDLKIFKKNKITQIVLCAQIYNDYELSEIRAEHRCKDIKEAVKKIKWRLFEVGIEIILGISENDSLDIDSLLKVIDLKINRLIISPLTIYKGTNISTKTVKGEYIPYSNRDMVLAVLKIIDLINFKNINLITFRNTHQVLNNELYISGPRIDGLANSLESELYYSYLSRKIKKLYTKINFVKVKISSGKREILIGEKNRNLKRLFELYGVKIDIVEEDFYTKGMEILSVN